MPVKVGLAYSTTFPDPVEAVAPVPPRATANTPLLMFAALVVSVVALAAKAVPFCWRTAEFRVPAK